jgi:predicted DNA-binding transcriptional regulator AlpA
MSDKRKSLQGEAAVQRPELGLRILREPEVLKFSGHKRSQMWAHVKDGTFPKPVRLSNRGKAVG